MIPALLAACVALPARPAEAWQPAAPPGPFFYRGLDYGSESQFGPVNVFTNVGLGVVGRLNASGRLGDIDLRDGFSQLGDAYFHPLRSIRDGYGYVGAWGLVEFVPILSGAALPNYFLHFLGEGMLTRKLEEYYEAEGLTHGWARAAAIATMVISQQANELVESQTVVAADSTADFVFNAAGIIAFCFDSFAGYFATDSVQLYYWPGQPVVDVGDGLLFNHGEDYILRTTLGDWTRWKLASVFGVAAVGLGVSTPIRTDEYITWGLILGGGGLPPRDYERPVRQPVFYFDHGKEEFVATEREPEEYEQASLRIYWDRQGSLLSTLDIGIEGKHFGLNIYPGLLDTGSLQLGAYAIWTRGSAAAVGLTLSLSSVVPGFRF
ncbi:MAG: hypothetical protein R3F43_14380 [bacterium]